MFLWKYPAGSEPGNDGIVVNVSMKNQTIVSGSCLWHAVIEQME